MCGDPGRLGDVFESHVAVVEVQATRNHVAGEKDVGKTIVIDVADGDAGSVVDIRIRQHVDGITDRDGVGERDPGAPRGEATEERRRRGSTGTARRYAQ